MWIAKHMICFYFSIFFTKIIESKILIMIQNINTHLEQIAGVCHSQGLKCFTMQCQFMTTNGNIFVFQPLDIFVHYSQGRLYFVFMSMSIASHPSLNVFQPCCILSVTPNLLLVQNLILDVLSVCNVLRSGIQFNPRMSPSCY